ncbi:hypothetical protein BDZ91DRAFT_760722 [Kalaharituber pfeilii]|nr:hypothetical protein BDZ91DRAFT_760722 [Kalaharituber pfeilii]
MLPPELISHILTGSSLPHSTLLSGSSANKIPPCSGRPPSLPYHLLLLARPAPRQFRGPMSGTPASEQASPLSCFIRKIELVRWNMENHRAGITSGKQKLFFKAEIRRLKKLLTKEGLATEWWMEKLDKGSLDANAAAILLLVAVSKRDCAGLDGGLPKLHVENALAPFEQPDELLGYGGSLPLREWSRTIEPFLDKGPFIWDDALPTIPNPQKPPKSNIKHLSLSNAHILTLKSLLACTPTLITLSHTQLMNLDIPEQCWVEYSVLGSALSKVRDTLTTLTLRTFIFGAMDLSLMNLGTECGPVGNVRDLVLSQLTNLRELTTNLTLILGIEGESGMTLSQALPEGLEILRLVDELKCVEGSHWERKNVAKLVGQYMRERGQVGGKGKLAKLVFIMEREDFEFPRYPVWRDWPKEKRVAEIENVARDEGVVVEYEDSWEWGNWCNKFVERGDIGWLQQTGTRVWTNMARNVTVEFNLSS